MRDKTGIGHSEKVKEQKHATVVCVAAKLVQLCSLMCTAPSEHASTWCNFVLGSSTFSASMALVVMAIQYPGSNKSSSS